MKALVNYSDKPGSVELRDMDKPEPDREQVLIQVGATGVCGSDIHMWHGPVSWKVRRPVVMGHEYAGTIIAIGENVSDWKVGDRVTGETAAEICGRCVYCRTGNYHLCSDRKGFGASYHGSMAEYIQVREGILHRVPDGIPFESAALTEPAAVAFQAVFVKSRPIPGDVIAVIGPGTIGLMVMQMVRLASPQAIVMIGLSKDKARLELAKTLGADHIVFSDREDPVQLVQKIGDGRGADLVVDAVGLSATIRQSLELVRPNGQVTKIGWDAKPFAETLDPLVAKAATFQGTFSHTWICWERVLALMAAGRIDTQAMVSTYPLSDWKHAFEEMQGLGIAKSVLIP